MTAPPDDFKTAAAEMRSLMEQMEQALTELEQKVARKEHIPPAQHGMISAP